MAQADIAKTRTRRSPTTSIRPRRPNGSSRSTMCSSARARARAATARRARAKRPIRNGVELPFTATTPYINTIPPTSSRAIPAIAKSSAASRASSAGTRWRWSCGPTSEFDGIGGHISTFASAATLYEVAFNHFFRGRGEGGYDGDQIYFQGHASPGHVLPARFSKAG